MIDSLRARRRGLRDRRRDAVVSEAPFDVTEAPSCFGGGESPSVAGWADPLFSPAHIRTPLPFDASGTARVRERRRSRSAEALTSWTRLHRQAARGWRRRCPV
ncbi:hypothetical protein MTO96_014527 [Rhipicephalus appendiculatus]